MRRQRSGTIVGISSIAGDRGRKARPVYGATKAALNAYLDSLRYRLHGEGVHVCTIRPGHVTTPMTSGMKLVTPIDADRAAREILAAVRARADVRYVPGRWRLVSLAIRLLPSALMRRLEF